MYDHIRATKAGREAAIHAIIENDRSLKTLNALTRKHLEKVLAKCSR